jgi:hypothetical protein
VRTHANAARQQEEDGPRPLVGFLFGNVNNKLRLQQTEGRYLGEARAQRSAALSAPATLEPCPR